MFIKCNKFVVKFNTNLFFCDVKYLCNNDVYALNIFLLCKIKTGWNVNPTICDKCFEKFTK